MQKLKRNQKRTEKESIYKKRVKHKSLKRFKTIGREMYGTEIYDGVITLNYTFLKTNKLKK